MYVEAFHRVLKYIYLKEKVNKHMDKCIHVLLKIARDKGFERLVKLEKGKLSERITKIVNRHDASLQLQLDMVTEATDASWTVKSASQGLNYYVTREADCCPANCSLQCKDCNICIHYYTCNCVDALIHNTICKHVHLIVRYQQHYSQEFSMRVTDDTSEDTISEPEVDGEVILQALQPKEERRLTLQS